MFPALSARTVSGGTSASKPVPATLSATVPGQQFPVIRARVSLSKFDEVYQTTENCSSFGFARLRRSSFSLVAALTLPGFIALYQHLVSFAGKGLRRALVKGSMLKEAARFFVVGAHQIEARFRACCGPQDAL